jgi:putative transposase
MAVAMRGELAEKVIFHADRGCQYTSAQLARASPASTTWRLQWDVPVCSETALQ